MNNPDMPGGSRGKPLQVEWSGDAALIEPQPWMKDARCAEVDPEMFFPGRGDQPMAQRARDFCKGCDVVAECLAYALRTEQSFDVWGGLTAFQRRSLVKVAS